MCRFILLPQLAVPFPISGKRNGGTGKFTPLGKVTELVSGRAGIPTRAAPDYRAPAWSRHSGHEQLLSVCACTCTPSPSRTALCVGAEGMQRMLLEGSLPPAQATCAGHV